jgi:hypothetical protein
MRHRLALCALPLFAAFWAQEAFAIVYVPGRYENGIYSRPHFLHDGERAKAGLRLRQLVGSGAMTKEGELGPDREGPETSQPAAQPPLDER